MCLKVGFLSETVILDYVFNPVNSSTPPTEGFTNTARLTALELSQEDNIYAVSTMTFLYLNLCLYLMLILTGKLSQYVNAVF